MKVQNTNDVESTRVKFVIAGEAGNGKTSLARTIQNGLNEKVFMISAEAGLLSIKGSGIDYAELQTRYDEEKKEWVQVPKEQRVARLAEIYSWLMQPEQMKKYNWIYIDSLTEISQNMLESLESQEDFQGPKNTIKKYGELSTRMLSLCKTFRDMPHYNVVFSALVKEEKDEDNQTKIKINVIGSFAEKLPALFDQILYLGVSKEVDETTGRNKRMILTQKSHQYTFPKDRDGSLDVYEAPDLSVIIKKIRTKPLLPDISSQAKQAANQVKGV